MQPQFQPLVDCELIEVGDGVPNTVSRQCYGHPLAMVSPETEDHLVGAVSLVPEGALVRTTCFSCGGHYEKVLALPELPAYDAQRPADFIIPSPELLSYLEKTIEPVMEQVATAWYPGHLSPERECSHSVAIPASLASLKTDCLSRARRAVKDGRTLGSHVYLLFEDEARAAVSFEEPLLSREGGGAERRRGIEYTKATARQYVDRRAEEAEVVGGVLVSEAWMAPYEQMGDGTRPSESPSREEALICQVFTREGGRSEVAPFERVVGVGGEFGDTIHPGWAGGPITEGVLAPVRQVWKDQTRGWTSVGIRAGQDGVH